MKLTFLGTRGNTAIATPRHRRHSALLVRRNSLRVMVDCGADWLGRLAPLAPDAIVLTHAHPDHAMGLREGAPCPVFALPETWRALETFPVADRRVLGPRQPADIGDLLFEAFPVEHSLRAPAVGYRITADDCSLFYVPDVAEIPERRAALAGVELYVGDGATMTQPMIRRQGDATLGHTTVLAQLAWCGQEAVPRAVFTHCGSRILKADERRLGAELRRVAREQGVAARFAYDGLELALGRPGLP